MSKLILVPTPVGNLDDITIRAIKTLQNADFIIAEDTRVTGKLLQHLDIHKPMTSFHNHNEHSKTDEITNRILAAEQCCMVSDAGTPGISDPGFLLVRACLEKEIPVETLPGPTAFVPALVNSGLPCERFCFEGFLPQKKGRNKRLQALVDEKRTMVFYESPHRVLKTLQQLVEVMGEERKVSVARELSKIYEENIRGTLIVVIKHFEKTTIKGEIVIVLEGKNEKKFLKKEK